MAAATVLINGEWYRTSTRDLAMSLARGELSSGALVCVRGQIMTAQALADKQDRAAKLTLVVGAAVLGGLAAAVAVHFSRSRHDRGVRAVIREAEARGSEVLAADHVPGYPRPPTMNGSRGDVVELRSDGFVVVHEVETTESVGTTHSRRQDANLRRARRTHGVRYRQRIV